MIRLLSLILVLFSALPAHAEEFSLKMTDPPVSMPPLVFEDEDGVQHTLADYHGRYVLLNIWATWCAPCKQEMPSLEKLQVALGKNRLAVVALSEDRDADPVTVFYAGYGIHHIRVAIDHAGLAPSILNLNGLPTTILINPQGVEVARMIGSADWGSDDAISYISAMIRP